MHENHPQRPDGADESAVREAENAAGAVVPERLQQMTIATGEDGKPADGRAEGSPLDRSQLDLGDTSLVVTPPHAP